MNSILNNNEFIPFNAFTIAQLAYSINERLSCSEEKLKQIEQQEQATINDINELFLSIYALNQEFGILTHLESVADNQQIRDAIEELQPLVSIFYVNLGQSKPLYKHFTQLNTLQLNNELRKVVANELRNFKLSGIDLDSQSQQQYKNIQTKLAQLNSKFGQNVLDATDSYSLIVNINELHNVPLDIINQFKINDTQCKLTLHAPCYTQFMQYLNNRELRKTLYTNYITRASKLYFKPEYDNSNNICQILNLRRQKSKLLGFNSYAELSLFTKMAKTPQKVIDFLYELAIKIKPYAMQELEELTNFARDKYQINQIEAYDITFISEQLQQHKYQYSNNELKQYFQLPIVLNGLFNLINKLYGINFKSNLTIAKWHNDVIVYDIVNKHNQIIGTLYMDLYSREYKHSGAWMNSLQDRFINNQLQIHKLPHVLIVCNFSNPQVSNLLSFDDVQTLFHEMGHALHQLLTKIDHYTISGINGVEWDAIELPSQFMEYFTWKHSILQDITCHNQSSAKLPNELFNKLIKSKNYLKGLQTLRQIEFALSDILIHIKEINTIQDIYDIINNVRQQIACIMPPKFERMINSFEHIFSGGYAAGYYSYKWAELLALDVFKKFDTTSSEQYPILGNLFYESILSKGGLNDALDNFISFMGREPKIDALLEYSGIN